MIRFVGSLFGVLALAAVCTASNCHVQRVVVHPHHVAPVVAPLYQPYYSIGYTPAGDLVDVVKSLIEENRAMRADLIQALKAAPGGPLPLKAEALKAKHAPAQASCVSCHDASVSKAKGDGVTLYEGGVLLDTPENVGRMVEAVTEKQTMPRGVKWGAQERLDFLRSLVVKTEAAK